MRHLFTVALASAFALQAQSVGDLATGYLRDLIRLDSSSPPGNETRVANYLKQVADREGIPAELLGADPNRLNFVARLKGSGKQKPLLLIAHSDVVPVDRSQWTLEPFAAVEKGGYIYGRGAEDDKGLLAAELAVMVDLARRKVPLDRDLILLSESDEESSSSGIKWMLANAWPKIDAEFALNEFSYILPTASGVPVFQIQTAEKVPTRVKLTARGLAGHGSLPRDDNAVLHLAKAIVKLTEAEQPVALNATTRAWLHAMVVLPDYRWLEPFLPLLENPATAPAVAEEIRRRDAEIGSTLHFTLSPTMLNAGMKINVIPNTAEALLDGRRLPTETPDEIYSRLQKMVNDPAVSVEPAETGMQPSTEPSSLTSPLYKAMEAVFHESDSKALVVPVMMRGTTDGAFLRARGIPVYGVPIFRADGPLRLHGNDERLGVQNLKDGAALLEKIVLRISNPGN